VNDDRVHVDVANCLQIEYKRLYEGCLVVGHTQMSIIPKVRWRVSDGRVHVDIG